MRTLVSDRSGVAAIEFSMVAPVFLALLLCVFQICFWLWANLNIQHATELAARCASTNTSLCSNASGIQNYAASQIAGFSVPASAFTISGPSCGNQVEIAYTLSGSLVFFGSLFPTIHAKACFPL